MTKKTDMLIYRQARVERIFEDRPDRYWVSIPEIGTRMIVLGGGEKKLALGEKIEVSWFPKGRCWIKR